MIRFRETGILSRSPTDGLDLRMAFVWFFSKPVHSVLSSEIPDIALRRQPGHTGPLNRTSPALSRPLEGRDHSIEQIPPEGLCPPQICAWGVLAQFAGRLPDTRPTVGGKWFRSSFHNLLNWQNLMRGREFPTPADRLCCCDELMHDPPMSFVIIILFCSIIALSLEAMIDLHYSRSDREIDFDNDFFSLNPFLQYYLLCRFHLSRLSS
jgi:hypothetical protein